MRGREAIAPLTTFKKFQRVRTLMGRGQAALEMFLALTLSLLLLLWVNNYAEGFASTNYKASVSTQQRIAMKAISSTINAVCARGGKATMAAPCIKRKADDLYYHLTADTTIAKSYSLYNEISGSTESATAPCEFNALPPIALLLKCTETKQLCISKDPNSPYKITISAGACG